jgi:hypothetical protein
MVHKADNENRILRWIGSPRRADGYTLAEGANIQQQSRVSNALKTTRSTLQCVEESSRGDRFTQCSHTAKALRARRRSWTTPW